MKSIGLRTLRPDEAAVYAIEVRQRLEASYRRYQRMSKDEAKRLAARRVAALMDAAGPGGKVTIAAIGVEGRQVGTLAYGLNREDSHLFLWDIHLEPDARRQGAGRAALHLLEAVAHEAGLSSIRLNVEAGNPQSDAFFRGLGFVAVSVAMARKLPK